MFIDNRKDINKTKNVRQANARTELNEQKKKKLVCKPRTQCVIMFEWYTTNEKNAQAHAIFIRLGFDGIATTTHRRISMSVFAHTNIRRFEIERKKKKCCSSVKHVLRSVGDFNEIFFSCKPKISIMSAYTVQINVFTSHPCAHTHTDFIFSVMCKHHLIMSICECLHYMICWNYCFFRVFLLLL